MLILFNMLRVNQADRWRRCFWETALLSQLEVEGD